MKQHNVCFKNKFKAYLSRNYKLLGTALLISTTSINMLGNTSHIFDYVDHASSNYTQSVLMSKEDTFIKGKVLDENGDSLIGVSIVEKGTNNGTVTDADGNYTLKLTTPNPTLVFSYVGYMPKEVPTTGKNLIDVVLEEDAVALDEFVVVAYGTQRKSSVSGSISSIKADKLKTVSSPDVAAMLQGKVAGVTVGGGTGQPGSSPSITIRGRGSISTGTSPLWVVDGVVGGVTSSLNPNDIESMSVLKDGPATALYGSRGANGVILVTTKSAKQGDNKINVSAKLGVVSPLRGKLRVMNSKELYDYTEAAFKNSTNGISYSWFRPELLGIDTDWWDIATQNALSQNYIVSLSMGSEKIKSYISADYYKEDGTLEGFDYKRYTVRNNNNFTVNKNLTIKTKINASYGETYNNQRNMGSAFTYLPWDSPYNSLGEIKTGKEGTNIIDGKSIYDYWIGRDANNYLYDLQTNYSQSRTIAFDGNFGFDYKIIDGLVFESNNNAGFRTTLSDTYTDPNSQAGASVHGKLSNGTSYYTNLYANQLLRYSKVFGKHDLLTFLGYEYTESFTKTNSVTGSGIPSGGEVLGVATTPTAMAGDKYTSKTMGYYFNGNYIFDERYMGQFSIRRDGSSKFGRDNRFGTFLTVGAGWNMHKEEFIKNLKVIDLLKLRLSWGSTGNTPSTAFSHMGLYQINLSYDGIPAAFPYQMANRNMGWEKTYTTNLGIDARLFDRVDIVLDIYNKDTSGLLYQQPQTALTGYSNKWINEGALWNRGIEVTVSPDIIKSKDFYWGANVNLSYNKNKITELAGGKTSEISGKTIREVDYALGTYYMREWAGVNPVDGTPQWFALDKDGNKYIVGNYADATLQRLDKKQFPDFTGGFGTTLQYKDFTLSANFTFATGFYIYHSGRQNYDNDGIEIQYNSMRLKDGWSRWEKPGDIATHPQVKSGGNNASNSESTRYLEKGDYLKMQNISLNYNVPSKLLKKYFLKSANIALGAENLFTITNFSGVDPELAINGAALGAGYSTPRRFTVTVNLGF